MFKKKQTFTHFISIPFISKESREVLNKYQKNILFKAIQQKDKSALKCNNVNHFHITICMLSLTQETKQKAKQILKNKAQVIQQILAGNKASFTDLQAFRGRNNAVNVLFLDINQNQTYENIMKLIKQQVIFDNQLKSMHISYNHNKGLYSPDKLHLTMFRVDQYKKGPINFEKAIEDSKQYSIKQPFPIQYVDISTRFEYDETGYYKPFERVNIKQ